MAGAGGWVYWGRRVQPTKTVHSHFVWWIALWTFAIFGPRSFHPAPRVDQEVAVAGDATVVTQELHELDLVENVLKWQILCMESVNG